MPLFRLPSRTLASVVCAAAALSACAPVIGRQGFQVQDVSPRDLKIGTDTKSSVMEKLGSPSAVAAFDQNTWFYVSQATERYTYHKARVTARDVTVMAFDKDNDKLVKLDTLGLKDGRHIAYNTRETPTRGRALTVLEQLLGSVGHTMLPQNDNEGPNGPAGHRPD
jgi:outer membrane protein assembly factor BamE (lipoprotein component of BamABCDE complex)